MRPTESAQLWEQLWAQRPWLLRLARVRCAHVTDAEDIVQEALTRALAADLKHDRATAWLTVVVVRLCVDRLRLLRRDDERSHRLAGLIHDEADHADRIASDAAAESLRALVVALPPIQRRCLELRAAGRTVPEMAAVLGLTEDAAESALARGRRRLRAALPAEGD